MHLAISRAQGCSATHALHWFTPIPSAQKGIFSSPQTPALGWGGINTFLFPLL